MHAAKQEVIYCEHDPGLVLVVNSVQAYKQAVKSDQVLVGL